MDGRSRNPKPAQSKLNRHRKSTICAIQCGEISPFLGGIDGSMGQQQF